MKRQSRIAGLTGIPAARRKIKKEPQRARVGPSHVLHLARRCFKTAQQVQSTTLALSLALLNGSSREQSPTPTVIESNISFLEDQQTPVAPNQVSINRHTNMHLAHVAQFRQQACLRTITRVRCGAWIIPLCEYGVRAHWLMQHTWMDHGSPWMWVDSVPVMQAHASET